MLAGTFAEYLVIRSYVPSNQTTERYIRISICSSRKSFQEFPPVSKSGAVSSVKEEQIEPNLEGLTTKQAMLQKRIFILDHHDYLMPFLDRINRKDVRAYASRTLLFMREDSTMKPVAIELSFPGASHGSEFNRVFLPVPASQGDSRAALWQLAKAHVLSNDSAYHHLISHWWVGNFI